MSSARELRADFDTLSAIGRQPQGGWSRPAFGPEDCQANEWFMKRAREAGLSVRADTVGNVIARLEGPSGAARHRRWLSSRYGHVRGRL